MFAINGEHAIDCSDDKKKQRLCARARVCAKAFKCARQFRCWRRREQTRARAREREHANHVKWRVASTRVRAYGRAGRQAGRTREQPFDGPQNANARAHVASVRARVYTRRRQAAHFNELDARARVRRHNEQDRARARIAVYTSILSDDPKTIGLSVNNFETRARGKNCICGLLNVSNLRMRVRQSSACNRAKRQCGRAVDKCGGVACKAFKFSRPSYANR